jgi:hypothetical protein
MNKSDLDRLNSAWQKALQSDGRWALQAAYELGRKSLRRAKCYFCDKVKPCHVLDLSVPGWHEKAQSFFVCAKCAQRQGQD